MEKIDWSDPQARLHLIEQIGAHRYNIALEMHLAASTVAIVNGYRIIPQKTQRFGTIFTIDPAGIGYRTAEAAIDAANAMAPGEYV